MSRRAGQRLARAACSPVPAAGCSPRRLARLMTSSGRQRGHEQHRSVRRGAGADGWRARTGKGGVTVADASGQPRPPATVGPEMVDVWSRPSTVRSDPALSHPHGTTGRNGLEVCVPPATKDSSPAPRDDADRRRLNGLAAPPPARRRLTLLQRQDTVRWKGTRLSANTTPPPSPAGPGVDLPAGAPRGHSQRR